MKVGLKSINSKVAVEARRTGLQRWVAKALRRLGQVVVGLRQPVEVGRELFRKAAVMVAAENRDAQVVVVEK